MNRFDDDHRPEDLIAEATFNGPTLYDDEQRAADWIAQARCVCGYFATSKMVPFNGGIIAMVFKPKLLTVTIEPKAGAGDQVAKVRWKPRTASTLTPTLRTTDYVRYCYCTQCGYESPVDPPYNSTCPQCATVSWAYRSRPIVPGLKPIFAETYRRVAEEMLAKPTCAWARPKPVGDVIRVPDVDPASRKMAASSKPHYDPEWTAYCRANAEEKRRVERELVSHAMRTLRSLPVCPYGGKVHVFALTRDFDAAVDEVSAFLGCDTCGRK